MYLSRRLLGLVALLGASAAAPVPSPDAPSGRIEQVPPQQALAILGLPVTEQDGKTVGRLVDVLIDAAGTPEAAVIDFGGFMGVGARKVAVHWSTLHFSPGDAKHPITLDLTPDQMKAAPEYKDATKPVPVVVPDMTPAARDDTTAPTVPPPAAR
jgi:hypothetical protein